VSAPGLSARPYFHRYTEDAIDLCDVFSSFSPQGKATARDQQSHGPVWKAEGVRWWRSGVLFPRGQDQGGRRLLRERPRHLRDRELLDQRGAADRRVDEAENSNDDGVRKLEHRPQNVNHDREFKNSANDRPTNL
jgi:hypothetical protein